MPRYDVYAHLDGEGFLLDVQSDLLDELNTRVVVPLIPESSAPAPARRLNPVFEIQGIPCVMVTQFVSAISASHLHEPLVSLREQHTEIIGALDMLFTGI